MAIIMDGKALSSRIKEEIKKEVAERERQGLRRPGLAVILVGEDPASRVYVRNKTRDCGEVGFYSREYTLPEATGQGELEDLILRLNREIQIDGILVQLPLPAHLDEKRVIQLIDPQKDVDAFGYGNVGRIMTGDYDFLPCTPAGVMALLQAYGIETVGKEAVVVGRSNIVGKPQALLLLHGDATVTVAHSRTKDLEKITKRADILVAAVGKARMITADMVKEGAVVIDVGMNRDGDGKLCGDVDYESVREKASYITPVPGGVGPMTRTMLMRNTLTAAQKRERG